MRLFIDAFQVRWNRFKTGDHRGVYLSRQLRNLLLEIREYYGLSRYGRKGTAYLVKRCLDEEDLLKTRANHGWDSDKFSHTWALRNTTQDALHMVYDLPCHERRSILSCTGPHCRKRILIDLARITTLSPKDTASITRSMMKGWSAEELREFANEAGKLQAQATALAIQKRFGGE